MRPPLSLHSPVGLCSRVRGASSLARRAAPEPCAAPGQTAPCRAPRPQRHHDGSPRAGQGSAGLSGRAPCARSAARKVEGSARDRRTRAPVAAPAGRLQSAAATQGARMSLRSRARALRTRAPPRARAPHLSARRHCAPTDFKTPVLQDHELKKREGEKQNLEFARLQQCGTADQQDDARPLRKRGCAGRQRRRPCASAA